MEVAEPRRLRAANGDRMKGRVIASGLITLAVMAIMAAGPAMADSDRDKVESFGYGYSQDWDHEDDSQVPTGQP